MINAYRKPLDENTLVIEVEGEEDVRSFHSILMGTRGPFSDRVWGAVTRRVEAFLDGEEMSPEAETEPYGVFFTGQDWGVYYGPDHRVIGHRFQKQSIAREAAATLNELVKLDRKV